MRSIPKRRAVGEELYPGAQGSLLRRRHLSCGPVGKKDLAMKTVLGREGSMCKGPMVGLNLPSSLNSKEASMAGAEREQGKEGGDEI